MSGSSASTRLHLQHLLQSWTHKSGRQSDAHCRDLVGIDVTDGRLQRRPTLFFPILIASLIAALFLVGLRNDLTAMRYSVAEALAQEEQLRAEKRTLTVEMRRLRDPSQLAARALELGFVHPERIVDLAPSERSIERRVHDGEGTTLRAGAQP
jgi:hypothetical protein